MNFKDKVNAVYSEVQELQNELGIPNSYIKEIFEMIEDLRDEKVMSVQETIDDYINRRVEEAVSTKLHDVFTKITTIEDSIRSMDIDHIESQIANLDDRADTFESEIYDLQNDVTCIEDKLEGLDSDAPMHDDINKVDKRVTRLEEDLLQFDGNVVESKIREAIGNLKVQLKVREV
jgi:chromosome segregation ATPase